ncbi:hypothetical protein Tco_1018694 [Tanacetum coccineum]|uniref:Uncharacterized protein n=1 Tax=Tanacetum coccineum TaxID=301880 RepID=A0ABQ5FVJ9_9ASTR
MSTQQDIYAAGSENRLPMHNKDKYVSWSSCLLHYAKSKPNGKLLYNSIMRGPYVRRMIPEPGDPDHKVLVVETFHEQTDDELTKKEVKQTEADDQAIQTILMGLPEDIYAAIDSCKTAQEIWLHVVDNGFDSLAMWACVNLRSRGVFNLRGLIKRDKDVDDGGRRDKAILHKLCILDGLLDVLVKGVKLVKILLNLVSSHGWLGLSTQPTPREVDRRIGRDEVPMGNLVE